jgi:hypothetical protein
MQGMVYTEGWVLFPSVSKPYGLYSEQTPFPVCFEVTVHACDKTFSEHSVDINLITLWLKFWNAVPKHDY